jgi:hypothetical protein
MKKIFIFGILALFLISFIFAQGNQDGNLNDVEDINQSANLNNTGKINQNTSLVNSGKINQNIIESPIKDAIRERNKLRVSSQAVECPENCTCTGSVTKCNLEKGKREMTIQAGKSGNIIIQIKGVNMTTNNTLYHHNGKVYGEFSGKQIKKINLMPDQIKEKVQKKIQQRDCSCNITLNEEGIYKVQTKKKARLFYLFPVRERIRVEFDSETGKQIEIRNPWWGFLAKDVKDESLLGESCGTVALGQNDICCQNKGYDYWNQETEECEFSQII